jgi:putative restriction endonuclease
LAYNQPDELNFWQPGGKQVFLALQPYDLFLFKLHSPLNYIAGGFFVWHAMMYFSIHSICGDEDYWQEYLDKVLPSLK